MKDMIVYERTYVLEVAQTIREQLVTMTGAPVLLSWGLRDMTATVYRNLPALKFHVDGRLFSGNVIICLNGSDYYEVYLVSHTGARCIGDEVFFDELGEIIDRYIERGEDNEEYSRFCHGQINCLADSTNVDGKH